MIANKISKSDGNPYQRILINSESRMLTVTFGMNIPEISQITKGPQFEFLSNVLGRMSF